MNKKLLLIDDERDLTDLAGGYLRMRGFDVECCNDPAEVFARLEKELYDGIIVDLMMFPVDGLSLVRRMRELTAYAQTPIFMLSAKALTDAERKELLDMRVNFISKPFHPRSLIDTLRGKLGGS